MIKTVLVNILDVAKDMQVPPAYLGTFMGYEIGAQAKFDAKKPERQQAFLSGEHDTVDLSKIATQFINECVLCPTCGLPELVIYTEDKDVLGNCRACGNHTPLPITSEKFKRYVFNHPPSTRGTGVSGSFEGNKTGAKKETKSVQERKKEAHQQEASPAEKVEDASTNVVKKKDEVTWFSDTSAEAAEARRREMLPQQHQMIFQGNAANGATAVVNGNGTSNGSGTTSPDQTLTIDDAKNLLKLEGKSFVVEAAKVKDKESLITLLFQAAVGDNATDPVVTIKKTNNVFKEVVKGAVGQAVLLKAVENFCSQDKSLHPKAPLLIKEFYDQDLLEEENIVCWFEKQCSAGGLRDQVVPLVKWLQEAETESDEESGEEDGKMADEDEINAL